jgi:hypothetical protein
MQNALPLEKTKQFLTELKLQVGAINEETFLKFESQSYAVYKTTFEKAILAVNISIDENNKINGFTVKPFVEDKKSNLVNGLSSYPLIISDKIYSLSKDFPNQTQISIALIHRGKVNFYGVKIENDTIKSFDNRIKIFEIGSITKVFTSSVLASLVVDHQVNLNDLVNDYYPFAFGNNFKPSFLNLANHTSGLPKLPNNFDITNETNAKNPETDFIICKPFPLDKIKKIAQQKNITINDFLYSLMIKTDKLYTKKNRNIQNKMY